MWSDSGMNDVSAGGGGFLNTSQFASPSDQEKKPARRAQNIVPVTAHQIINSGDDFKIGEFDIQVVTLVGLVEAIEATSTKITYTLSDDTGTVNAVLWLEGPVENNDVVEHTYCRVYGSLRTHQGKRHVMIFKIHAIKTLNELTFHILEVVDCNLAAQQMKFEEEQQSSVSTNSNFTLSNSLMDVKMNDRSLGMQNTDGLTTKQRLVLNIISSTPGDIGPSKQEIANMLTGKVSVKEIGEILEFLSSEGHIYSTIDDDHYAYTS
ncbi:replication protein A 32 kDa subunit [Anabrus simplex]|uniref:replication protein A 32 kDa subunit n=1 Tax=Anabrus simplex TaxID=316456 RepID=UPI0034DD982D